MFYIWSMQKDFAKLIRDYQARHNPLIVLAFHLVLMRDSELRLTLDLAAKETIHNPQSTTIQCINAVDYSLIHRPRKFSRAAPKSSTSMRIHSWKTRGFKGIRAEMARYSIHR